MNIRSLKEKTAIRSKRILAGLSLGSIAMLLAAAALAAGSSDVQAGGPADAAPVAASLYTVEPRTIESVVTAAGALSSKNSSVLSSKVMGRVSYLGVQDGDQVPAGKLLIRIDSGEITAQAVQAQAAYNNAKLHYDRIRSLYDAKASTQMEMDHATLGLETAQAGLTAAKAMESYTVITAPIRGQVVEKRINLGEMALPGQPLLKIEDSRSLRLEVTVREQDILQIHPGKAVKVLIDAMPGKEIPAKVSQVVSASDVRTHSFIVKVDVPAEKGLITGMYGKALFSVGTRQAFVVPKSAVVELSGISGVYVVTPQGNAVFQMVQLGGTQGNMVEVVSGLKQGDRVIADKHLGRLDGKKIVAAVK